MPRLGLLLCDSPTGNRAPPSPSSETALVAMMERHDPGFWQYCVYRCSSGSVPDAGEYCDAWIIGGSRFSAYEAQPWIERLKQCVRRLSATRARMLGICFGHQLVHSALGGTVSLAQQGWGVGAYPVVAKSRLTPFDAGDSIRLLSLHQDQVTRMAPGFSVLAGSAFCPASITCKGRSILTVQGHPEMNDSAFAAFCQRDRGQIGEPVVDQVLATLGQPDHRHQVQQLLARFLRTGSLEPSRDCLAEDRRLA